jgi:hypothetical protein
LVEGVGGDWYTGAGSRCDEQRGAFFGVISGQCELFIGYAWGEKRVGRMDSAWPSFVWARLRDVKM